LRRCEDARGGSLNRRAGLTMRIGRLLRSGSRQKLGICTDSSGRIGRKRLDRIWFQTQFVDFPGRPYLGLDHIAREDLLADSNAIGGNSR